MVARYFDGQRPPHFTFDLQPEELSAIGYATVQWSYLEFMLYERTRRLSRKARVSLPQAASDSSFARRLRAFRELVTKAKARNSTSRTRYEAIAQRIANVNGTRQRLIHHVWECNPRDVSKLLNVGRDLKGRIEHFDVEKIARFGDEVGALSLALAYPKGWTIRQVPLVWMSRRFLLEVFHAKPSQPA